MKKSTKTVLLIAVCLISAGLVLTVIGVVSGASPSRIIYGDLWTWKADGKYDSEFNEHNTYSVDPDDIDKLYIDWISGSIEVIPYAGDQILIQESCRDEITEENCLRYQVRNGCLDITCRKESIGISFSLRDDSDVTKQLTVKVPMELAGNLKELEIDAVSSDILVNGMTIKAFSASTVSGNVTLEQCSAADIQTDTTSGDVDLSLLACPKDFEADSTSGDITLQLPHDSSFRLEFDTVSGRPEIKGFDANCLDDDDDFYEYLIGDGKCEFSADTTSGDITVIRTEHH